MLKALLWQKYLCTRSQEIGVAPDSARVSVGMLWVANDKKATSSVSTTEEVYWPVHWVLAGSACSFFNTHPSPLEPIAGSVPLVPQDWNLGVLLDPGKETPSVHSVTCGPKSFRFFGLHLPHLIRGSSDTISKVLPKSNL